MKRIDLRPVTRTASCVLLLFLTLLICFGAPCGPGNAAAEGVDPEDTDRILGIDVSDLTDVEALGFLSKEGVRPWGHLLADETDRIFLAEGDTVYVAFEKGYEVKPGDLFTVYKSSDKLEHPLTGRDMGYVVYYLGRLLLMREVKPGLYKARIVESYNPMHVGEPIIPFTWISPCVRLCPPEWERLKQYEASGLSLVAAKGLMEIIGQLSVVYMNHGLKHGIRRGNFFQILAKPEEDRPREAVALPDQALGYLLVLEALPDTATGVVVRAKREFTSGALLRAVDVTGKLEKILKHYNRDGGMIQELEDNPLKVMKALLRETEPKPDLPEALHILATMPECSTK